MYEMIIVMGIPTMSNGNRIVKMGVSYMLRSPFSFLT